ncbi:MAG: hypothetical protein JWM14_1477 [Chitinophagaceae bacterium]|nr:hypothetical protein [Chitinophagaceae bacterium]
MTVPTSTSNTAKIAGFIFYGNYFYGICVVAQAIEATLQQGVPLNGALYYGIAFIATVFYYNYPYVRKYPAESTDPRTEWYKKHYYFVRWNQRCFAFILVVALIVFLYYYHESILHANLTHWLLIIAFPAVALMYYGLNVFSAKYNLRKIGWLKPFIIGFTWAGMVSVYPVLFYDIIHEQPYLFTAIACLLFLKNLMYISVLAMMFDIKDYAADSQNKLNTFVVKIGLRKMIFYLFLPLPLLGVLTFLSYATLHHFHLLKMVLIMIPFFLLILAGLSLRKRRTLMYYLVVIDGLMVVKAAFGIVAMLV